MKWWRVDRHYWRSDLEYKICWSTGKDDAPVFLAWAPRRPERERDPGELLTVPGVGSFQAARAIAERHAAEREGG